jgi:predicted alpha/beta hydrolase family esterase
MKKAIIIHGWGANPTDFWFQREKKLLEKRGYKVEVPQMPHILLPEEEEWVDTLAKLKPDRDTILIGHSLGTPTILRYLEKAQENVNTVFLVSPFSRDLGNNFEAIQHFVDRPFDWGKIKSNAVNFYTYAQTGDVFVPPEFSHEVAQELGTDIKIVTGDDHFATMDLDLINRHLPKD